MIDKTWYGLPETAIKVYIKLCPECLGSTTAPLTETMNPLKTKKAAVVGRAMIRILSSSVIPEILQSDKGSEFLGKCIAYIKQYFPTVNIVKGKPQRPQTQGSIEKGNGPFKRALEKWMVENPEAG